MEFLLVLVLIILGSVSTTGSSSGSSSRGKHQTIVQQQQQQQQPVIIYQPPPEQQPVAQPAQQPVAAQPVQQPVAPQAKQPSSLRNFAVKSYDKIASDDKKGKGEHLSSLLLLMESEGIPKDEATLIIKKALRKANGNAEAFGDEIEKSL